MPRKLEVRPIDSNAPCRQHRALNRGFRALAALLGCHALSACGNLEGSTIAPGEPLPGPGDRVLGVKAPGALAQGTDDPPRVTLVRQHPDGTRSEMPGEYVDAVEFRDGQAAVTRHRELFLVRANGARSVLARRLDGLPTRASDGSLVYAARFGDVVELHRLTVDGELQRLASFRGSATRLAPQTDGRVVFVGSESGGVSGVWIADARGARCLTNCDLRVGKPWGSSYRPPPGEVETVSLVGDHVEWLTPGGNLEVVPLKESP